MNTERTCANQHCANLPEFPTTALCRSCYRLLLTTGRLPIIEAVFVPAWRKRDLKRDESGRVA